MSTDNFANIPDLWRGEWPKPKQDDHKYDRGHLCIFGAPELTGATRLCTQAALYSGVGLISILAKTRADIYRVILPPDIMVSGGQIDNLNKISTILAGPGGIEEAHLKALNTQNHLPRVIDSSAFQTPCPKGFYNAQTILTPHTGEFVRLFPEIEATSAQAAIAGAKHSGAIVVLKGPATFVAHPDGRCAVLDKPNPHLARAGTGDVLAGIISGMAAQKMPPFEAACAGVYLHARCAELAGRGLIASELHKFIRPAIDELIQHD